MYTKFVYRFVCYGAMRYCPAGITEYMSKVHYNSRSKLNALNSFCVAFTPKSFKLSFPKLYINTAFILYTGSLKYLGFTFSSSHKDDIVTCYDK